MPKLTDPCWRPRDHWHSEETRSFLFRNGGILVVVAHFGPGRCICSYGRLIDCQRKCCASSAPLTVGRLSSCSIAGRRRFASDGAIRLDGRRVRTVASPLMVSLVNGNELACYFRTAGPCEMYSIRMPDRGRHCLSGHGHC